MEGRAFGFNEAREAAGFDVAVPQFQHLENFC